MHPHEAHEAMEDDILSFGPFQLNRTKRILSKEGTAIAVRSRAFEILMALTDSAGSIVSNRELLRRVWPNTVVESGTVRVHVAQLRSVLRKADPANEYVHNVTGLGYRFVASITHQSRHADTDGIQPFGPASRKAPPRRPLRKNNLPQLITPILGRDQVRSTLLECVARKRFVTVTGAGGIGKTTAAIVAAEAIAADRDEGVCFLDLAAVERSKDPWSQLAATLEVSSSTDLKSEVIECLGGRSSLLVLDNCEHVLEIAASLAEGMLRLCPHVKIIATSREPLRARGELVYELPALELPTKLDAMSRESLLKYSAIQLFVERAGLEFDEREMSLIGEICRRVAGNPLSVEIAAGQCRWLGLRALAVGLSDEMYLSLEGQRTVRPRHRTLRASFDWSYGLLANEEREVLRRLSELTGRYTVDHALAAIEDELLPRHLVVRCLIALARKSLLVTDASDEDVLYGLHNILRAYVQEKCHRTNEVSFIDACRFQDTGAAGVKPIRAGVWPWQPAWYEVFSIGRT